jgi:uracil-DNA glycosylase
MRWSERQQQLLRAMGLTLWQPPAETPAGVRPEQAVAPVPAPAPVVLARPTAPAAMPAPPARPLPVAAPVDGTRAGEIATLDWPALRETVAACRACALCESRSRTVFGVGHEQARWMIVGEAPGEQEDRQGEPFVGPAGQLLDRMLAALGLTRSVAPAEQQVFIANTLKCRPPRNRNPDPAEMQHCLPFLERQIALVQPKIILAMGRFAVQALLGSGEAIGRLRGQVHHYRGIPVVVSYHPAYLLRNPADKARSWADLCLAASLLDAP